MIGAMGVVHAQAVVLESVAHYEPVHVQTHVVAAYLVEDLLCEGDVRCLVFHYHQRLGLPAEDHRVAALACGAHRDGHLVGDKPCGIALVGDEKMDEMLPHPLLGSECHVFAAQGVEHHRAPACGAEPKVGLGQVESLHSVFFGRKGIKKWQNVST